MPSSFSGVSFFFFFCFWFFQQLYLIDAFLLIPSQSPLVHQSFGPVTSTMNSISPSSASCFVSSHQMLATTLSDYAMTNKMRNNANKRKNQLQRNVLSSGSSTTIITSKIENEEDKNSRNTNNNIHDKSRQQQQQQQQQPRKKLLLKKSSQTESTSRSINRLSGEKNLNQRISRTKKNSGSHNVNDIRSPTEKGNRTLTRSTSTPFISIGSVLTLGALALLYNPSIVLAADAAGISTTASSFDLSSTSDFVSSMGMILPANMNTILSKLGSGGFLQAFSLVFVSEIGDKTFFIAGLLAMKTSRLISFIGSMGALAVMTVISVLIGQIFHAIPNIPLLSGIKVDDIAAVVAFAFFGLKTLKEAYELEDGDSSGIEEERKDAEEAVESSNAIVVKTPWATIFEIFSLVFAAEFGDRSFLSTIALGAAQNPISVAIGAIAAHATATGIAVLGGAFLSKYLSEKVIGYIGGSLFLVFAFTTALGIF